MVSKIGYKQVFDWIFVSQVYKYLDIQIYIVCVLISSQSWLAKNWYQRVSDKYFFQKYLIIQIYLLCQSGAYGWQKLIQASVWLNICVTSIQVFGYSNIYIVCVLISIQIWLAKIGQHWYQGVSNKILVSKISEYWVCVIVLISSQSGAYSWQKLAKIDNGECPKKYWYCKYLNIGCVLVC